LFQNIFGNHGAKRFVIMQKNLKNRSSPPLSVSQNYECTHKHVTISQRLHSPEKKIRNAQLSTRKKHFN